MLKVRIQYKWAKIKQLQILVSKKWFQWLMVLEKYFDFS